MTTTFEKFANETRRNYSELPKIDVEILDLVHHCQYCEGEVRYDKSAGRYGLGAWVHVEPNADCRYGSTENLGSPRTWCKFCHNEDPATVRYRQHAWYDATECDRCGGVDGFAIGD